MERDDLTYSASQQHFENFEFIRDAWRHLKSLAGEDFLGMKTLGSLFFSLLQRTSRLYESRNSDYPEDMFGRTILEIREIFVRMAREELGGGNLTWSYADIVDMLRSPAYDLTLLKLNLMAVFQGKRNNVWTSLTDEDRRCANDKLARLNNNHLEDPCPPGGGGGGYCENFCANLHEVRRTFPRDGFLKIS